MGDPRLLRQAEPVEKFGTRELDELITDMFDTMHDANGAERRGRGCAPV